MFKGSDEIVLKKDSPAGVDLSKDIRYFKSPYYQMLFGLQKEGSEYKYIVFADETEFLIKKYRMVSEEDENRSSIVSKDDMMIPGARLV